jgi:hypothetical protein
MMVKSKMTAIASMLLGIAVLAAACTTGTPVSDEAKAPQPEPTQIVAVGSSIDKPVPLGYDIMLQEVVLSVRQIVRPANDLLSAAVSPLENGKEYLFINIINQCVKAGTVPCFSGDSDFRLLDSAGNAVLPEPTLAGVDGLYSFQEFSIGSSNKGFLAFVVDHDQSYPIMTFMQFDGSQVYLSLAQ